MLINLSPLRRNREFRLLFTGQLVSFLGSMMTFVAVPYQLYSLTHSSWKVGLLGSVQLAPLLLSALWGGALADSMDRRKLLIVSELLLALGSLALLLNAAVAHPSVLLIFLVSGGMSALNGFHRPALDALSPLLVRTDELPAIAALGSLRSNLGSILGPALGGLSIASLGLPFTYGVDVLSFIVSLAAIARMSEIPGVGRALSPGISAIAEGLRYARSRPELVGTYVVDIIAMIFAMPMALFPAMAERWGGAGAVGWLYSAMSIGALAFTLLSGWTGGVRRHGAAVALAALVWGLAVIALGFAPGLASAVFCLVLAGAADSVSALFRQTIWNQTIPRHFRGRLAGVEMISYMSGPLLGNARAGYVASVAGNTVSIVSGGVLCVLGVLACIPLLPKFWKYAPPEP